MKKIISIVGPTASGKTSLSIHLAKKLKTDIINVDSVQMVTHLDIGSAKIKDDEKEGIVHHFIDIVDLDKKYTIYDFQKDFRKLEKKIKLPLLVGGSGLYLKSAIYDYVFKDEIEDDINYESFDLEKLKVMLLKLDANYNGDFNNKRRVIRAIKMAKNNHLRSSQKRKDIPLYDSLIIYLDLDRAELKKRVIKRLDLMFEKGFLKEAQHIFKKGYDLNVIGYRELNSYFKGEISLDEAKNLIVSKTMSYAKRQKTFFKNQFEIKSFNALDENLYELVENEVGEFLKK